MCCGSAQKLKENVAIKRNCTFGFLMGFFFFRLGFLNFSGGSKHVLMNIAVYTGLGWKNIIVSILLFLLKFSSFRNTDVTQSLKSDNQQQSIRLCCIVKVSQRKLKLILL
jgi:hypothetical protein